jgi:hypothetical protein
MYPTQLDPERGSETTRIGGRKAGASDAINSPTIGTRDSAKPGRRPASTSNRLRERAEPRRYPAGAFLANASPICLPCGKSAEGNYEFAPRVPRNNSVTTTWADKVQRRPLAVSRHRDRQRRHHELPPAAQ